MDNNSQSSSSNKSNMNMKNLKQYFGMNKNTAMLVVMVVILIWVAIVAIFYGKQITTFFFPAPMTAPAMGLDISSRDYTYTTGEIVSVELGMQTVGETVWAARAIIWYDDTVYSVEGIDWSSSAFRDDENCAGVPFMGICWAEIDTTSVSGEIRLAVGKPITGVFNAVGSEALNIATINFMTLKAATAPESNIFFGTASITPPLGSSEMISGTITCNPPPPGTNCIESYQNPDCICSGAEDILLGNTYNLTSLVIESGVYDPDFNGDGNVNAVDLTLYAIAYRNGNPAAEVNGDGNLNAIDLTLYAIAYRNAQ